MVYCESKPESTRCGANKCNFVEKTFAKCRNFATSPPRRSRFSWLKSVWRSTPERTPRQIDSRISSSSEDFASASEWCCLRASSRRGGRMAGACVGAVSQINKRLRSFECALVLNFSARDYLYWVKLLPLECSSAVAPSFQSLHFFQLCIFFPTVALGVFVRWC